MYTIRHVFNFNIYNEMPQGSATQTAVAEQTELSLIDLELQHNEQQVAHDPVTNNPLQQPAALPKARAHSKTAEIAKPKLNDGAPPKSTKRQDTPSETEPTHKRSRSIQQSPATNTSNRTSAATAATRNVSRKTSPGTTTTSEDSPPAA
ncbi:unnamed protein product [Phytophthora fragariaefolia]|uniref:Unnamed protein product n=1 Tax=Phytophthora fragariaefolia TaxID=1490495 RepID=A0A9W6XT22_9STRA|nr:unnamed protein product [Phytophthora fragariaefolia]